MASLTTCARPYAQAAFDYAKEHKAVTAWVTALEHLSHIIANQDVQRFLAMPELSIDEALGVIVELYQEALDPKVNNFLRVMAEYEKLSLLPIVYELFLAIKREDDQCVSAKLITAQSVDKTTQKRVIAKLEKRFGKKIDLVTEVDASLIGGAKVCVGDEVFDGSLRGGLDKLAMQLRG